MSRATPFASGVGSSSWADDDDVDTPIAKPEQHEQEPIEEEHHDDEYPEHRDDRRDDDRGYREERGGYREDRGGYPEDRRERGDDRRGGYERPKNPVPDQPPFKVYVGNLPFRMNEDDLADFFGPRDIADIRIPRNEEDRPKGFAYVEFATRDALVAALELDGRLAGGRAIRVDVAIERERERKPRQHDNFFERRSDRPGRDNWERDSRGPREPREPREPLESRAPRERQRLTLLPRTASSEQDATPSKKASIFGDAKPRDESAYQERKERERKERERKVAEAKEAKAKAKQAREERGKQAREERGKQAREERGKQGDASDASDNTKTTQAPRSGRSGPRTHEDLTAPSDRAPPAERTHAKREEPRAKPLPTATKAKSATKVQNVFDLLNDDDDSDSD